MPKSRLEVEVFVLCVVELCFFTISASHVWCGHTAVYNAIDFCPKSKKYWFFSTGSLFSLFFELLFPKSAKFCILFPRVFCPVALVFPPLVVSVASVHVCIRAQSAVCGLEIQKGRQACGSQLSLSVISVSLACNHVGPGGVGSRKARARSNIDNRLLRVPRSPQVESISTPPAVHVHILFLHRSRIRLPALPIRGSVVSTSPLASIHRITRYLLTT